MKQKDNFPALAALLRQEFEAWANVHGGSPTRSARKWAEEITKAFPEWQPPSGKKKKGEGGEATILSHSALHEWRQGLARPQSRQIEILAKFFYPNDPSKQVAFTDKLREATKTTEATLDPLDALAGAQRAAVKVGYVPYAHFCHADGSGFLDGLLFSVLSFAGLPSPNRFTQVEIDDVEDKLCKTGGLDIVVGLFAEPQRSQMMKFFREIPLSIPLNAVVLRSMSDSQLQRLAEVLTTRQPENPKIVAVVDPKELGGLYAHHYLDLRLEEVKYEIKNYAKKLKSMADDESEKDQPVVIIDEVSCLRCLQLLWRDKDNRNRVKLVFGASSDFRKNMPRYRYTFAVARHHTRWAEFLSEALEYFVESNHLFVEQLFLKLKNNLLSEWREFSEMQPESLINDWFVPQARTEAIWADCCEKAAKYKPTTE